MAYIIATDSRFARTHVYESLTGTTAIWATGSTGIRNIYGCGHRASLFASSRTIWFVDGHILMGIYFRMSNAGNWSQSAYASCPEGGSRTIYSAAGDTLVLRWRGYLKTQANVNLGCNYSFSVGTAYYVNDPNYPKCKGLKLGIMTSWATNPTYTSGTKINSITHNLIYKP